jgi:uncharacterized protein
MTALILKSIQQAKKLVIAVIGFTILIVGIAMIVLPGPAVIVIPVGLGILATEFVWAKRLLNTAKNKFQKKKREVPSMKPSEREAEYISRMEFERKKKAEEDKHKLLKAEEKKNLKDLHYMRCPKCGMDLIEIDYKEIKMDKCSECDGIWLDAGELEAVSRLEKGGLDKLFGVFRK